MSSTGIKYFFSKRIPLSEQMNSRKNNLDSIRLVAALLVIVDHAFPLEGSDPFFNKYLGYSLGTVAVGTFFFISGILITQSWLHDPSTFRYSAKRILRIYPAYIICILICAFVLGSIFTTLKLQDYLTERSTWVYVIKNLLMFPITYGLPGVFTDNPYPQAVNGSIWTLPLEITGYILILGFGATRLIKRKEILLIVCIAFFVINIRNTITGTNSEGLFFFMPIAQLLPLLFVFLLGAVVTLYKDKIFLNNGLAIAGIIFCIAMTQSKFAIWGLYIGWMYFILVIGFQHWKTAQYLTLPGDLSYGIYIYAFPVQQTVAKLFQTGSPLFNMIISMIIVYPIAFLSWKIVEKPSLKLKPGRNKNQAASW